MKVKEDNSAEVVESLGFCGCGSPIDATEYILSVLEHVDLIKSKVWEDRMSHGQWKAAGKVIFPTEGAEYFAYYVLTEKGLMEHGGAVPDWLTDEGYAMIAHIKAWRAT